MEKSRKRRWFRPSRIVGFLILLFWGGVLWTLHQRQSLPQDDSLKQLFPWAVRHTPPTGSQWMGLYLRGKKIGYVQLRTEEDARGFRLTQRSHLALRLMGTRQQIESFSRVRLDKKYRIRHFTFRLRSPMSRFQANGVVRRGKLRLTILTGRNERHLSLPYRPALLSSALRHYIAAQKPPPGRRFRVVLFDPQTLSYRTTIVEVEGYETLRFQGKKVRTLRYKQTYRGVTLHAWLDEKGHSLKEKSSTGMTLLRETPRQAVRGIRHDQDLIQASSIQPKGRIRYATTRRILRLRLLNLPLDEFPDLQGGRQTLQGEVVTIRKERVRGGLALPRSGGKAKLPGGSSPRAPLARLHLLPHRRSSSTATNRPTTPSGSRYRARPGWTPPTIATSRPTTTPLPHPKRRKAPTPLPDKESASRTSPQARRKERPPLPGKSDTSHATPQAQRKERPPLPDKGPTPRSSLQARRIQRALRATALVQSDHPAMQRQARHIVARASHRLEAIRALVAWVYGKLRKKNVVGIPSALEILQNRVGDCNEHSTLLAALGRAVKIPTRIVAGVAYQRGRFYYHAWNECYLGQGRWLTVDATWGQIPADVTHLALVRGGLAEQIPLLRAIGHLQIQILPP